MNNTIIIEDKTKWIIGDKLVCINNIGLKPLVFGQIYVIGKTITIKHHLMVELIGCPAGNLYLSGNFKSLSYLKYINSEKKKVIKT